MNLRPWLVSTLPLLLVPCATACTTYEYFTAPAGANGQSDAGMGFPDASAAPPTCPPGQWCSVSPALTPADLVAGWASPTEAFTWVLSDLGTIYRYDGATWSTAYVPDHEVTGSSLWALSKAEAWVSVIDGRAEIGGQLASRFVHWDGTSWSMGAVSYPVFVRVVWGSAPDDYWAAGFATGSANAANAILHYDGTSWTSVPVPDFPIARGTAGIDAELVDLHGTSRTDAWVMSRAGGLAHWDGTSWTLADLGPAQPAVTDVVSGLGIWANAADDVWYARRRAPSESGVQAVEFLHFDGTSWQSPVLPVGLDGCTNLGLGSTYAPGVAGTLGRSIAGRPGVVVLGDALDTCAWTYDGSEWFGQAFGLNGNPFRTFVLGTEGDSFGLGAGGALGPVSADGTPSAAIEPAADDGFLGTNHKVSATGANDAWALSADPSLPLPEVSGALTVELTEVVHWDGARRSTMTPLGGVGGLSGLAALSPTNVWAVGCRVVQDGVDPSKTPGVVSLHYDGTLWHESLIASGPEPCVDPVLNDVWAVGSAAGGDVFAAGGNGLVTRWAGTAWRTLQGPIVPGESLTFVTGTSANDVFFVGTVAHAQVSLPVVLHWDGTALTPLAVPAQGISGGAMAAFADGPSSVWVAVNWSQTYSQDVEVLSHWDGTAWSHATVPSSMYVSSIVGGDGQVLVAGSVAATYEEDLEGNTVDSGALFTFDGASWTRLPLLGDITGITSATVKGGALWVVGDNGLFAQQTIGTEPTR